MPVSMPHPRIDRVGDRYGDLVVISYARRHNGRDYWRCKCTCGKETVVIWGNLQTGNTKSCGCKERLRHGHARNGARSSEYGIWLQMRDRCRNPNNRAYRWYGARGVSVCERWNSYANFLSDMGPKPKGWWSIDRINPAGNYCPDNCRWATRKQQRENQRPRGSLREVA